MKWDIYLIPIDMQIYYLKSSLAATTKNLLLLPPINHLLNGEISFQMQLVLCLSLIDWFIDLRLSISRPNLIASRKQWKKVLKGMHRVEKKPNLFSNLKRYYDDRHKINRAFT